jgi:microcystin degradation protein MlrC
MKIIAAMFKHETNTFSPIPTPISSFGKTTADGLPMKGDAAVAAYQDTNNALAAYIDIAAERGAELVVPVAANAHPSGTVSDDAFEIVSKAICEAVGEGCDVLLLELHGAMVAESFADAEGELLQRIRAIAPDLPIAVALDFHSNFSSALIDNATVIAGYRTYPHIDIRATGERAARAVLDVYDGKSNPVLHWRSLPMLTHMLEQTPSRQPMKDIMDRAAQAEDNGEVICASVFGGFPLADIPHVGLAIVVADERGSVSGVKLLDELTALAWERRAEFVHHTEPMAQSIADAKSMTDGPILLADHGDNTGAGGLQDVMTVLAEVMAQKLKDVVAGPFTDPDSVVRMIEAGVGAEITIDLGGKIDMPAMDLKGQPLTVSGRVKVISDGRFKVTGPMMTGTQISMGRTVVLDTGDIDIVVSEKRYEPFDVGCFSSVGIDITKKQYILIKSRQHFRAGFEPLVKDIVLVAGPGVCSSDYDIFPFKNLRRPIYPLDPDTPLSASVPQ